MSDRPLTLEELVWKYSPDSWDDIRHLTDAELVEYLFRISNGAYTAALGDHRPARSAIGVAELPLGALVEVEAWAWVGG